MVRRRTKSSRGPGCNRLLLLAMAAALMACSASSAKPPHGLSPKAFPMPAAPASPPQVSFAAVDAEVAVLQQTIGTYPPRFTSEQQRDATYARWSRALVAARSLDGDADHLEGKLYLLGELYRQGHNLDVEGSAPLALTAVERCIELYPRSRRCHLSASLFYLSIIGPVDAQQRAERSLTAMRALAAPGLDEDAEAGFISLAIARGNRDEVDVLISRYLTAFPRSPRVERYQKILASDRVWIETYPAP